MIEQARQPAIFVGFRSIAAGNPEEYLEKPTPPVNYGEEKVKEWNEGIGAAKWQAMLVDAAYRKGTGQIEEISACNPQFGRVLNEKGPGCALKFVRWLEAAGYDPARVVLFGFDVKPFVRVSGGEFMKHRDRDVSLEYWYQHEECYDPYDMIIESECRKALPLPAALKLYGIPQPEGWTETHVNPEQDMLLAMRMVTELALTPACVDATKFATIKPPKVKSPKVKEETKPVQVPETAATE